MGSLAPIQIFGILFAIFAILITFLRYREKMLSGWGFLFWNAIWSTVIFGVMNPEFVTRFGLRLGIGRALDLILIMGVVVSFYMIFRVYIYLERIRSDVLLIVKELSQQAPVGSGDTPFASAIVVNYNGLEYLEECISSLVNQTYKNYEIIFVDNASVDGSVEYVRENFPSVKIVENDENLGFAGGNNKGARISRGGYIAFLNADAVAEPEWLEELVKAVGREGVGACQSKLLLYKKPQINSIGNEIHFLGFGWVGGHGEPDSDDVTEREIAYPSGAAMIIKRDVFLKLGLFDEDTLTGTLAYHDDLDLGWRMRMIGYKSMLAPRSVAYHKYTFKKEKKLFYLETGRLTTLLKNYSLRTLILIFPAFLASEVFITLYTIKRGWFGYKIESYISIFSNIIHILRKRKIVQDARKASDREVVESFTSKFDFKEIPSPVVDYVANPALSIYWKLIKQFI